MFERTCDHNKLGGAICDMRCVVYVMWVCLQYINSLVRFKSGWAPFGLIQAIPISICTMAGSVIYGNRNGTRGLNAAVLVTCIYYVFIMEILRNIYEEYVG